MGCVQVFHSCSSSRHFSLLNLTNRTLRDMLVRYGRVPHAGSTITAVEQPTQDLRLGSQLLRSPTDSSAAAAMQRSSAGDFSDGPDAMRLGLRMEQRAELRQLTRTLQHRLSQASSDLQVGPNPACTPECPPNTRTQ